MKQFGGFPERMQFTPVPNVFFSAILPQVDNLTELKVILFVFRTVYAKKGSLRYISYSELLSNTALMAGIAGENQKQEDLLNVALASAIDRGYIFRLTLLAENGGQEDIFMLNGVNERRQAEKITNGELAVSGLKSVRPAPETAALPDIFTEYEENIGMITPIIADELREAEKLYPQEWIRDAIREAVSLNKRSWRYIERILENWTTKGRGDGSYRGDTKADTENKFSKQKYGHIVRR